MYCLCVDWCSLSCHTVTRQFVLNLIKACIYQATFLYFGGSVTILYQGRAQAIVVWLSCTRVLYPFLLSIYLYYQGRINSDYNLMCFNSILSHIDIDVSEEHAYPFTFERCSFHLRMNIVIFSGWLAPVRSTVNMSVLL